MHWESIGKRQHVSQDDRPRQHNMQQSVHAEFPETSYSALLHGPDTPPFHPEPAWNSSAEGKYYSAAEYLSRPSKGVNSKNSASLDGCEGAPSPFRSQHSCPEQMRTEQKLPTKGPSNLGDAGANEQALFNTNVGLQIQHPVYHLVEKDSLPRNIHRVNVQQGFHDPRLSQQHPPNQEWDEGKQNFSRPFEQVDASLSSNAQSFMQSQQCAMSFTLERKDVNCSQPQSQEGITEENISKQKGMGLSSSGMPTGYMPNGFDPQQYSAWNVMHNQSMSGADGSQMQHASHTGYTRWDINAWQEGHPIMEHAPYLPYGSGHMQMAPNHGSYNWQTHSTGTTAGAYPHYYPDGYYSCGSTFSGIKETDSAAPPPCETYGHHYSEPQIYLPPANQFLSRFGTSVIGDECKGKINRTFAPQDHASQKNHERLVNAGGQVQPGTLQSSGMKGSHVGQSANIFKKFREENVVKNENTEREIASLEKDVELEGPQVKKLRESSEVDAYQFKSCQFPGKVSPQTGAGSFMNVAELSGVDATPSSSRNYTDLQCSTFVEDRQSQALFQGSGFVSGTDEQGQSSEIVTRTIQRYGMPSHLPSKDAMQAETSASLLPGHRMYRNYTNSTSSVEYGAGLSQSDSNPGIIKEFSSTEINCRLSTAQVLSSADLLMSRDQVASPPGPPQSLKNSTFQQVQMPAVSVESVLSGRRVSSDAATQELPESQSVMLKPSNIGEVPGSLNISSIRYHDTNSVQYAYSTPGHSFSSIGDKGQCFISNLHPEVEQQRTLYSVTSAYPSHLQPSVQMPELKQFDLSKAGKLENGVQLRGFGRPALEKFYPPPPFHSHPSHFQRESGRVANMPVESETLPEVRALETFETSMLTRGMTQIAPKLVNYQANAGYMVEGAFLYPAPDGAGVMRRGSVYPESTHAHPFPVSSLEAGSVSRQQPDNMFLYAQATHTVPTMSMDSRIHSSSTMAGSQGAAGPAQMPRDNETSRASQPSAYPDPLATARSFRQDEGLHPPPGHYGDIHTEGREHTTFIDSEAAISGKTSSEQIPQQASKTDIRASLIMQPKKRKKSVPSLIPWHILTAQPRGQLPSISKAELMWATATNRLSDKDGGGVTNLGIFREESRLKLTTQLMQQLLSPLPSVLMHGKQPVNLECGVYNLSKSALGEACRLMAGTRREIESAQKIGDIKTIASNGQTRMWNMAKEIAMTRLIERFMERIKRLDFELARLDCSMSVLELRGKSHDLERLSIVHRLGKHHGSDFSKSLSENRLADAINNHGPLIRKTPPQKYVIAVPMPRTLPEGSRCLSL